MNKVILSFGSNLGDRKNNILHAKKLLVSRNIIKNFYLSRFLETKALLKKNSPDKWNLNYINAVATGFTDIKPRDLIYTLKNIEKEIGRESTEKWAPRIIDIDIIFYDKKVTNEVDLTIPHPEILKRSFLLELICHLEPDFIYPIKGEFYNKTIKELYEVHDEKNRY